MIVRNARCNNEDTKTYQSNTTELYYVYYCIRATCFDSYRIICILEGPEDDSIRIETCCPSTIINIIKFCCVWLTHRCVFPPLHIIRHSIELFPQLGAGGSIHPNAGTCLPNHSITCETKVRYFLRSPPWEFQNSRSLAYEKLTWGAD